MRIYGTFDGFKNFKVGPNKYIWKNVSDEVGKPIKGVYLSEKDLLFAKIKMKFGNRYMLEFDSLVGNEIMGAENMVLVNKNPRCDIFRKYKDEFHIIGGKYQGKKDFEIPDGDLIKYCLWLAKNTINEASISNAFQVMDKIKIKNNISNE